MHYQLRPLTLWTQPETSPRRGDTFRSSWDNTVMLLADEIARLGGDSFVIEVDADEHDITISGTLRRGARPRTPRVRVSFDSKHGPLRYATDAYHEWRANVRAVALGLEALRAVDRYGISSRAEQYVGYKAISAGTTALGASNLDPDVARKIIAEESGYPLAVLTDHPDMLADAIRKAKRESHPDRHNGDDSAWNAVDAAARALQETAQ